MGGKKKRQPTNLSFLNLTDQNLPTKPTVFSKSTKTFGEPNGVVGLGIVAALDDHSRHQDPIFNAAVVALSPKSSKSIPILCNRNPTISSASHNQRIRPTAEEMEMCEEYTCVISHVGDKGIKKREYFDDDLLGTNNGSYRIASVANKGNSFWGSSGLVSTSAFSSSSSVIHDGQIMADFLNACFLCKKILHGLDIFMYREKAFCTAECRHKQIIIEERKEKRSKVLKPVEYSASPCSGSSQFSTSVAAA